MDIFVLVLTVVSAVLAIILLIAFGVTIVAGLITLLVGPLAVIGYLVFKLIKTWQYKPIINTILIVLCLVALGVIY